MRLSLLFIPLVAVSLSGCIVTAPAKALYNTAKIAGKTVYYTGKGVYKVGELTVKVADGVLDGTERMLRLTILTATAAGAVVQTTRIISAATLEAELAAIEKAGKATEVIVDVLE